MDLIGRDAELTRLIGQLNRAGTGGRAVLVTGPPGIGKSALLDSLSRTGRDGQTWVVRVAASGAESDLPFAALDQLLSGLKRFGLPVAPPGATAELEASCDGGPREVYPMALTALAQIRQIATRRRVLILVDDAQWLDQPSADVMAFVARRVAEDQVLIVMSASGPLQSALAHAPNDRLELDVLDATAAAALSRITVPVLAPQLRERTLREAMGNPLALIELSRAYARQGLTGRLSRWGPLPSRLQRAFLAPGDAVSLEGRAALILIALSETGRLTEIVEAMRRQHGPEFAAAGLAGALDTGAATLDGPWLRCRHPLTRLAIYHAASLAERLAAQAALGDVTDGTQSSWHSTAGIVPDESAASELEGAAQESLRAGLLGAALAQLRRASDLSHAEDQRGRRALEAAEIAVQLGEDGDAASLLELAQELDIGAVDRARAVWLCRLLHDGARHSEEHLAGALQVIERLRDSGRSETAREQLVSICECLQLFCAGEEMRRRVANVAVLLGDDTTSRRHYIVASTEAGSASAGRSGDADAPLPEDGYRLSLQVATASLQGDARRVERLCARAVPTLQTEKRVAWLVPVLAHRAWALWALGDWDSASVIRAEVGPARPSGRAAAMRVRTAEAMVAAGRGERSRCEALVDGIISEAPAGWTQISMDVLAIRGVLMLAIGRPDEAFDYLRRSLRFLAEDPGMARHAQHAVSFMADAAFQSPHASDVAARLDDLTPSLTPSASPELWAGVTYARAILAGDDVAEACFAAALADDQINDRPFLLGRLLLAQGAWLRRRRRSRDAREPLRLARELFDQVGASPWCERAHQELRASGEHSRRRGAAFADELTPQEVQIARFAAAGLSNREIARRLSLSPRTVGTHMYRIFPKLNIGSRRELTNCSAIEHLSAAA